MTTKSMRGTGQGRSADARSAARKSSRAGHRELDPLATKVHRKFPLEVPADSIFANPGVQARVRELLLREQLRDIRAVLGDPARARRLAGELSRHELHRVLAASRERFQELTAEYVALVRARVQDAGTGIQPASFVIPKPGGSNGQGIPLDPGLEPPAARQASGVIGSPVFGWVRAYADLAEGSTAGGFMQFRALYDVEPVGAAAQVVPTQPFVFIPATGFVIAACAYLDDVAEWWRFDSFDYYMITGQANFEPPPAPHAGTLQWVVDVSLSSYELANLADSGSVQAHVVSLVSEDMSTPPPETDVHVTGNLFSSNAEYSSGSSGTLRFGGQFHVEQGQKSLIGFGLIVRLGAVDGTVCLDGAFSFRDPVANDYGVRYIFRW